MLDLLSRTSESRGRIGDLWCSLVHDSAMWPIHNHYECRVCGRQHLVPWAGQEATSAQEIRETALPSLRSALLPGLLLFAVLMHPVHAATSTAAGSSKPAAAVLSRFVASQEEASEWSLETIEIEASLPNLKKTGRLRAIRRLLPAGHPEYQVLDIAGDPTVKKQIIVRYVSADERATELPVSTVAIVPTNYKIHYAGTLWLGDRLVYAFRITPHKKREGLINGMLWLDSETAMAVRESGFLAKNPSIFLKRVNLTREIELHNGAVEARITHVSVETRLFGRAQLMIVERPSVDEAAARGAAELGQ